MRRNKRLPPSPSRDASATRPQYTDADYHSPVCRTFWVDSTPDTSCTITLLNLDVALRNGIHIDRTKTVANLSPKTRDKQPLDNLFPHKLGSFVNTSNMTPNKLLHVNDTLLKGKHHTCRYAFEEVLHILVSGLPQVRDQKLRLKNTEFY